MPGLPAKNVLDVQLVVSTLDDSDALSDTLSDAGFPRLEGEWWDEPQDGGEKWLKRVHVGADPRRAVNLHVRSLETPAWRLALLFPAWLRANPAECDAYADLKYRLAALHADDGTIERYADDKQAWIGEAFARAESWAAETGWTP